MSEQFAQTAVCCFCGTQLHRDRSYHDWVDADQGNLCPGDGNGGNVFGAHQPVAVAYRFTIRPAGVYHCPDGWIDIVSLEPSQQWNYGTVTYPEPLTFEVADHWSLAPDVGPRVTDVVVDSDEHYRFGQIMGEDAQRIAYQLAVGILSPDDVRQLVQAQLTSFELTGEVIIDENAEGRSLTVWRDA